MKKNANTIDSLETGERVIRGARRLQRYVAQYFKDIFMKRHIHCISMRKGGRESIPELGRLEMEFSNEKIKEAVWNLSSKKSPGPDGFPF